MDAGTFLPDLSFMTGPFPCIAVIFFICVLHKTYRYFLRELRSSSAFALEKNVNSSTHCSCGPRSSISAQPEALSPCPSDADTNAVGVPASSSAPAWPCQARTNLQADVLAWPQHVCVLAEVPRAQGWGCPSAVLLPGWDGEALLCQLPGETPLLPHPRELLDLTGTQMPL